MGAVPKGAGSLALDYSDVQGLTGALGGTGNVGGDPSLVANGAWNDNDTPDDPSDDFYVSGDARLAGGSPCVDAADSTALHLGAFDLDGYADIAELLALDLSGGVRQIDDPATPDTCNGTPPIVDMGAYEVQGEKFLRGDMTCNGMVDFDDIDPFVTALISRDEYESQYPDYNWLNDDIDENEAVEFDDIDGFVACVIEGGCE